MLGIEHHQVLPGTAASMAPGFEDAEALAASKSADDYWAASGPHAPEAEARSVAAAGGIAPERRVR